MGRLKPPASAMQQRGGLQDEQQVKNRILVGQITSVDDINGQVMVRFNQTQENRKLAIPLYGFSIQSFGSSWIRYMPQAWDFVKVLFEPDNTPLIIGYATFGEEFSSSGDRQGSVCAPRQSAYATVRRLSDDNVDGMSIFRRLKPGEWDMRSSGGAELYGTKNGTLTLAGGGGADIRLIKERQEIKSRSRLHVFEDDGVEVRFGNVRRLYPPNFNEEEPLIPNPSAFPTVPGITSTLREFKVSVGWPTPPLGTPKLSYWDMDAGTVTNSVGAPVTFLPAAQASAQSLGYTSVLPLRYRWQSYGADGLIPATTVQVDQLGNVQVTLLPTAAPVGLATTALRQYHHATTTATLASSLPASGVFLGSEGCFQHLTVPAAIGIPQAYVLGTAWASNRAIMNTAKVVSHGLLSTGCWTPISGGAIALGTAMATLLAPVPPTDPDVLAIVTALAALAAALTTGSAIGITQEGNIAAAITAFETAGLPTGYLSVKVFGE